jgi:hypothetical protein
MGLTIFSSIFDSLPLTRMSSQINVAPHKPPLPAGHAYDGYSPLLAGEPPTTKKEREFERERV